LVTDGGGDTTKQSGHLRTGLSESENVVDEEQHILAFLVTEVLGDSETSKSHTCTCTRGLVHLTEDKGYLGVTLEVDNTSLDHFMVQIVTLTSTFANTYRIKKISS
jgi:peptide chain release factor 1